MKDRYEELKEEIRRLQEAGEVSFELSLGERADWAYGNAVIENDEVTREMAELAVRSP